MDELDIKAWIPFEARQERPMIGARYRHIRGNWTGTVIKRPADASPGIHETSIWLRDGLGEARSNSPDAFRRDFEPYAGPDIVPDWFLKYRSSTPANE